MSPGGLSIRWRGSQLWLSLNLASASCCVCVSTAAWVLFSGFGWTGLPELPSTSHKVKITRQGERQTWILVCVCVCEWKKQRQKEQHKFTFAWWQPEIHTSLMHPRERQRLWESFFLSQIQNLKSPISADWQLWFLLGWPSSGGKLDQEGRVWEKRRIGPLAGQTDHLPCTMLSAWSDCADQKWALPDSDAAILSVSHYVSSGSRVSWFCCVWRAGHQESQSPSESELVVNHHGKTDGNSRCSPHISRRNAHLMHNRARLQTQCLFELNCIYKNDGLFWFVAGHQKYIWVQTKWNWKSIFFLSQN